MSEDLAERAKRILGDLGDGSPAGDLAAALDEVERLRRTIAVEYGDQSAAPEGWEYLRGDWWWGRSRRVGAPLGAIAACILRVHAGFWVWSVEQKTDDPALMSPDGGTKWEWVEVAHGTVRTALAAMVITQGVCEHLSQRVERSAAVTHKTET